MNLRYNNQAYHPSSAVMPKRRIIVATLRVSGRSGQIPCTHSRKSATESFRERESPRLIVSVGLATPLFLIHPFSLALSPAYSNTSILLLSSHPAVTEKDALTSCNEMCAHSANPLSGMLIIHMTQENQACFYRN